MSPQPSHFKRLWRHLVSTHGQARRHFPSSTLKAIEQATSEAEQGHRGEVRFIVESALPARAAWEGVSARERAIDLFAHLRMWDTELRSGVLIYVLLADHRFEIVADRGIASQVDSQEWASICREMEHSFKSHDFQTGVITGIQRVAALLRQMNTASEQLTSLSQNPNEISDRPLVLR